MLYALQKTGIGEVIPFRFRGEERFEKPLLNGLLGSFL